MAGLDYALVFDVIIIIVCLSVFFLIIGLCNNMKALTDQDVEYPQVNYNRYFVSLKDKWVY